MEPEYVPSELPDPWHPGAVYFEASMRPSCFHLADATQAALDQLSPKVTPNWIELVRVRAYLQRLARPQCDCPPSREIMLKNSAKQKNG